MDHISDSFLETNVPLLVLIEAAKSGNEKEVKEYAQVFREHANKLVEVSLELFTGAHTHTHIHLFLYIKISSNTQLLISDTNYFYYIERQKIQSQILDYIGGNIYFHTRPFHSAQMSWTLFRPLNAVHSFPPRDFLNHIK